MSEGNNHTTAIHQDVRVREQSGDPTDPAVLRELVSELRQECSRLQAEVAQLREAMTTRGVIEQAKGILGWQSHHDPEEMFAVMASVSQASNLKVRAVAELVVSRATHGEEVPLDVLRRALIDAARRMGTDGVKGTDGARPIGVKDTNGAKGTNGATTNGATSDGVSSDGVSSDGLSSTGGTT